MSCYGLSIKKAETTYSLSCSEQTAKELFSDRAIVQLTPIPGPA
jgi:hypothetical protein